jgi:hypothetical protein
MHASCLCGSVTWDINAPVASMSDCHCSICRKTHGTAFATYVIAPAHALEIHGHEHMVRFDSSPEFFRNFCGRCGSVVPGAPFDGSIFLPAGNFDEDPGIRSAAHWFVRSNPAWFEITDDLPCFESFPPGFPPPEAPDQPREALAAPIQGSCLCGAVAFEATGEPLICRHCHCTRCRKARSAAHASNLVVPITGFCFTRGEDHLTTYKVPEALFFTQVFCHTCGSPMPRIDTARGFVVIPMGGLDADPGVRPRNHIFVGSMAPWFKITDALPQFMEQQPA